MLSDPTTDLLVRLRPGATRSLLLVSLVQGTFLTLLAVSVAAFGDPLLAAVSGVVALVAVSNAWQVGRLARLGRLSAALLPGAHWRPVEVTVLRHSMYGSDLGVVVDGATVPFRVVGLVAAHRVVVRRTGTAWLVDGGAVAAIRVEGSHEAYPATRLPKSPRQRPVPRLETGDPTAIWARLLAARAWQPVLPLAVVVLLFVFFVGVLDYGWVAGLVMVFVMTCLVGAVSARTWYRVVDRRLPGLVAVGGWLPVGASVTPWSPRRDSSAKTTAALRYADGTTAEVALPNAMTDLLGAVHVTGGAWVAGRIEPGRVVAVGYPGYPMVAVGRVTTVGHVPVGGDAAVGSLVSPGDVSGDQA
ncbi:hypothetical protein [Actinokineospora cianjurensis]|uniref:hypothetical protein n=1 Tax=Actinokineospora cianjurensis TaxID=585224 RepID=UPI0011C482E6|nr:hypothetical protein [Actinokineospora cianjurensis]